MIRIMALAAKCFLTTVAFVEAAAAAAPPAASPLLIRNATLIDGTGAPPRTGVDILVRNRTIAAIGRRLRAPPGAQIVEATGKYVIPGLIDAHVHLGAPVLFQLTQEERERVVDYTPRAFLFNGVTTVLDAGSPIDWIIERRQSQREGRLIGPRIFTLGNAFKPENGWGSRHGGGLRDAAAAHSQAVAYAAAGVDGFKVIIESGLGKEPTHAEIPQDMLDAVTAVARHANLKIYAHATGLGEYRRALGIPAQAIMHGLSEPIPAGDPLLADMVAHSVTVIPTLSLFRSFLGHDPEAGDALDSLSVSGSVPSFVLQKMRDPAFVRKERELFVKASLVEAYAWAETANPVFCENVRKMHNAGVKIAVGTDAGGTVGYNFQGYNTPWEVAILTECGLSPMEALVASTRNGALAIGVADRLGTVERGKLADMLILSADPLKEIRNIRAIDWVVQSGTPYPRQTFAYGR
jgi:imidazolonepropionase-like amidohydrolase